MGQNSLPRGGGSERGPSQKGGKVGGGILQLTAAMKKHNK